MIFTFYKARGMSVGGSLVEDDKLDLARKLEAMAKAKGVQLLLPTDVIVADKFDANANTQVRSRHAHGIRISHIYMQGKLVLRMDREEMLRV